HTLRDAGFRPAADPGGKPRFTGSVSVAQRLPSGQGVMPLSNSPAPRCPSGNPGTAWSDVMANAGRADEQSAQQVEAPEKDSPLLDLSDAAVKKFIKTAKARGYVTYDELNALLPSEEVSSEQIEDTMSMLSDMGITVVESADHEEE